MSGNAVTRRSPSDALRSTPARASLALGATALVVGAFVYSSADRAPGLTGDIASGTAGDAVAELATDVAVDTAVDSSPAVAAPAPSADTTVTSNSSTAHAAASRIARMAGRDRALRGHGDDAVDAATAAGIGTVNADAGASGDRPGDATATGGPVDDGRDPDWSWNIPDWLPPPPVPADNPMNAAKVALGRHLFYDRRLSADESVACASCHEQGLGFADGKATAVGIHGTTALRNSMSLANVGYSPVLTWGNPHLTSLERQALVPLFGEEPLEMGSGGQEQVLFERLGADEHYPAMFREAFPERDGAIDLATLTRALAAFQRTLISVDSPYDRYKYGGDTSAMSESALRGEALFFSETAECYHCHQGFNFTDTLQTSRSGFAEVAFHNTGLYDIDGQGAYPPGQTGLHEFTNRSEDMGRFRTQSLRNVAVSAPYFHDGSAATLDDVLDHYAAGGRTLEGRHAGRGNASPWKNSLVKGFTLEDGMREDLKAFLRSLTDESFLSDPRFSNPWPDGHPAHGRRGATTDEQTLPSPDDAPDSSRS